MKVIACCTVWVEKEIEVDDKYDYLKKDWNDFTKEEKVSCDEDTYELHDEVLSILKKELDLDTFESIRSEETGEYMWED